MEGAECRRGTGTLVVSVGCGCSGDSVRSYSDDVWDLGIVFPLTAPHWSSSKYTPDNLYRCSLHLDINVYVHN